MDFKLLHPSPMSTVPYIRGLLQLVQLSVLDSHLRRHVHLTANRLPHVRFIAPLMPLGPRQTQYAGCEHPGRLN